MVNLRRICGKNSVKLANVNKKNKSVNIFLSLLLIWGIGLRNLSHPTLLVAPCVIRSDEKVWFSYRAAKPFSSSFSPRHRELSPTTREDSYLFVGVSRSGSVSNYFHQNGLE